MCAVASREMAWRNPITGIAACCARAGTGHIAAPPRSVMNSRRLIRTPQFAVLWSQVTQKYCEVTCQVTPRAFPAEGALALPRDPLSCERAGGQRPLN